MGVLFLGLTTRFDMPGMRIVYQGLGLIILFILLFFLLLNNQFLLSETKPFF